MDVHGPAIEDGHAGDGAPVQGPGLLKGVPDRPVMGDAPQEVALSQQNGAVVGSTDQRGIGGDGIERRLEVRRGARDDSEDLGRGRLLLQRLSRLVEQPDILDGDDSLVGEECQKIHLAVGERARLGASNRNGSDRSSGVEHGDNQHRATTETPRVLRCPQGTRRSQHAYRRYGSSAESSTARPAGVPRAKRGPWPRA